jgi:sterol O-acyltransferase
LFVLMLTFTHFMKMHSYTLVNRDLRREWISNGKKGEYPKNVSVKDYLMYLVRPVLVYQTSYPSRSHFRPKYFLLKTLLMMVHIVSIYVMICEMIIPTIYQSSELSLLELYVRLMWPCVICYIIMFFIIFEHILNLFAELSLFGDREFYQDWWNSDGFGDFSRKWNRPVHLFLYKHVYLECIKEYKLSEKHAKYVTFIFSGLCHELIASLICRKITPYLFGLMMFQIPLILLVKILNLKDFGIYLFWTGIYTGPALLLTLYCKF